MNKIAMFFLGILCGIVIVIITIFLVNNARLKSYSKIPVFENISKFSLEDKKNENDTERKIEKNKGTGIDTIIYPYNLTDSLSDINNVYEDSDDIETEFSENIAADQKQETVAKDCIINSRDIKIKMRILSDSVKKQTPPYTIINVQQWSTPIKNSLKYSFSRNFLKIKGLDINYIELYYIDNLYYLFYNTKYYPLHETDNYEKLITTSKF